MGNRKFSQYRGSLSFGQIATGMNAALKNAKRLAEDARTLFDAGRIPSATALAILSIEESGKVPILRQIALCESDEERCKEWKRYRSHTNKNVTWILGQLVMQGARTLDAMREIADPQSDHPKILEHLKQLCLYTDCLDHGKWSLPDEVSVADIAPYLVKMADVMANPRFVTAKEVELWHQHLLPVKSANFDEKKRAVARWYEDMASHGLSKVSLENLESFLRSGNIH